MRSVLGKTVPVLACLCLAAGAASGQDGTPCPTGIYLSARLAAGESDFERAADMFRICLIRDSGNPQLLNLSFLYSIAAGRVDDAVPMAKKLVRKTPDGRAAHLALAMAALKARDYAEARAQLAWVAKGTFAPITMSLIDMWAAAGAGDEAAVVADLDAVRKAGGMPLLTEFATALVAEYRGDVAGAEAAYRKTLHDYGMTPRLLDAFGRFLERNGKAQEAEALYRKVPPGGALRPIALAGLARIARGEKPAPLIAGPDEGAAETLFGIAASLSDDEDVDASVFYLRLALYLRPHFDLADMLLASRFSADGKYDTAAALFGDVSRDSPYRYLADIQRAEAKGLGGDDAGALKDMEALAKEHAEDVDVFMTLGDFRRRADDKNGAIAAYGKAIALAAPAQKGDWKLYFARASIETEAGDWPAAEADLQAALALDPEQSLVLNYLGYTWVDRGERLDEALKMLEKASEIDPENGFIADSVGWAYYRLGQQAKAVEFLERAVSLSPQDPTINDHLGDAYWKAGRQVEARFQWSHALTFGAKDAEKATIDKKLEVGLVDGK